MQSTHIHEIVLDYLLWQVERLLWILNYLMRSSLSLLDLLELVSFEEHLAGSASGACVNQTLLGIMVLCLIKS